MKDARNVTTFFGYDAEGHLTETFLPGGGVVKSLYDMRGRKHDPAIPTWGSGTMFTTGSGELVSQTDALEQVTGMTYDELGRLRTRTDATGTSEWVYFTSGPETGQLRAVASAPDPRLKTPCSIPGTTVSGGNRSGRIFTYTRFGEIETETECIGGESFLTTHRYDDPTGREDRLTYPAVDGERLAVGYFYTN